MIERERFHSSAKKTDEYKKIVSLLDIILSSHFDTEALLLSALRLLFEINFTVF